MTSAPVELPDNLAACHAVIRRQAEAIDELTSRVEELLARIDHLNRDLAAVKRQLFGSRRERFVGSSKEGVAEEEVVIEQDPEGTGRELTGRWRIWYLMSLSFSSCRFPTIRFVQPRITLLTVSIK